MLIPHTLPTASVDTLPKLLQHNAHGPHAGEVALRHKRLGIWSPITWKEYAANVRETFLGLRALGFSEGDRAFFISENAPELLYLDLAVQVFRGILAGTFPDSLGQEITYVWNHVKARFAVAGDQEQADKLLALDLPGLERLIVIDNRGMTNYTHPVLMTFADLMVLGRNDSVADNQEFEYRVVAGRPEDPVALMYTSGTTGNPKGSVLSQAGAIYAGRAMAESQGLGPDDEVISYLPYSWVGERMFSLFYALAARYKINFPEDAEMEVVLSNWKELMPSISVAPARVWESLCSRIYIGIDNTTRFKRQVFRLLMPIGYKAAHDRLSGRNPVWWVRILLPVAELLLFRWIRTQLGLRETRSAFTGGSALGPEVFTFFHAIGVKLRQIYGQTESSGVAVLHQGSKIYADTVGEAFPGMELRISDTGEVLLRGPLIFAGYLNNPEATAAAMENGWLRTGDQGSIRDGQLLIFDRMKEVCRTKGGDEFSPQLLQNKLKFSRFIREAVVVGHDRSYVAALIQIDYDNVGNWATRRGIQYTTYKDLSRRQEVRKLVEKEVEGVNRGLPPSLRIQRFHLLEKELDADDNEITRTAKIRRSIIEQKYGRLINTLYEELVEIN